MRAVKGLTDKHALPDDVDILKSLVVALQDRVTILDSQLRLLLDREYGRKTEKLDAIQGGDQLFLDGHAAAAAAADAEDESETIDVPAYRRRRKGAHGRDPFPAHLPRNRVDLDPPEDKRICSCCGKKLVRIGEEITERGHVIPARFVVNQYVRGKWACPEGHDGVRCESAPAGLIDRAKYETSMYAHLACAKYADHLPLHRLHGIFKRYGLKLSKSLMWSMLLRVAELLEPVVRQMKAELIAQRYLRADETPITLIEQGQKGSRTAYIWSYLARIRGKPCPVFDFTVSRSRAGPGAFLAGWPGGILQVDAYSGYNEQGRRPDIERAGCWAHVRRKFMDALGSAKGIAMPYLLLIKRLYWIEAALKVRRRKLGMTEADFHAMRTEVRGRRSARVLEKIRKLGDDQVKAGGILPKSPIGNALDYMLNEWSTLEVFLKNGEVELDNNDVERALRHVAIGRKNYLFTGSERGGWVAAVLYSLVSSCKALDIDPEAYIADTLEAVAKPATKAASLTPWAWAERNPRLSD